MKNNFSQETRSLFEEAWECWICGMNTSDSLHHITGRGTEEGVESSPLNACLICNNKCHISNHNSLKTENKIKKLLEKTYKYLSKINYEFTNKDVSFIEKYIKYYK